MRIAVGNDHAGFPLKQVVITILREMNHTYEDFGCSDTSPVDYPDISRAVAEAVAQGRFDYGILICSTGIGMCIAANKVAGIRAALCHDTFTAQRAREHNDANVLCLGSWVVAEGLAREVIQAYLTAQFQGGRHARRVEKIARLERPPS